MKRLGLLILTLLLVKNGYALPTIHGATGLITVPSAEALQYKQFNMGYDYIMGAKASDDEWYYKANIGTFKNWEIGIVAGKVPTEGAFVNVKYYLMSDSERYPLSLAIGSENLFSRYSTDIYMVASKKLPSGAQIHLGFKGVFQQDEFVPYVMGGVDYWMTNVWSVMADFSGEHKKYQVNLGVRYCLSEDVYASFSVLDMGKALHDDPQYSLGISFAKFL